MIPLGILVAHFRLTGGLRVQTEPPSDEAIHWRRECAGRPWPGESWTIERKIMPEYLILDEDEVLWRIEADGPSEAAERSRETDPDDWEMSDEVYLAVREADGETWQHFEVIREYRPHPAYPEDRVAHYFSRFAQEPDHWGEPTPEEIAEVLGEDEPTEES